MLRILPNHSHQSYCSDFPIAIIASYPSRIKTLKITLLLFFSLFVFLGSNISQETLMGLTSNGGAEGGGTIFSIKTNNTGFQVEKTFANWGKYPTGNLVAGPDGNFYGMTNAGGIYDDGTIFSLTAAGTIKIVHNFSSLSDGANPYGSLILGADGNFYGLTNAGGTNTYGTIFKFNITTGYSVIRHFNYATDGTNPFGSLVIGKDGNFYGVTRKGGSSGNGTIFRLTTAGVFTVIKTFNANPAIDGGSCYGSLTVGADSSLYGINYTGGTFGNGTIFRLTMKGEYSVIHHLKAATDGYPYTNSLVQAPDGFLYGVNYYGGLNGQGTIFKINKSGAFSVIRHLVYKTDGSGPSGSLIIGADGKLYGATKSGGAFGGGTIFKIGTDGVFTLIKSLNITTDGGVPKGSLFRAADGNYYGTTSEGGNGFFGTIFKISATGVYTLLTHMNGGVTGNAPYESLVQGKDYAYYGTTSTGGVNNNGTVFKLCGGRYSVIKSFNKGVDGGSPKGTLLLAADGNFYGTTTEGGTSNAGTIFRITQSGGFAVIYHFLSPRDGASPQGALVEGANGQLYGMTAAGGAKGGGTIFKITTAGAFSVIRHLTLATDGANPEGGLARISDTLFMGLTANGATVFKISVSGNFTVLKKMSTTPDGNYPSGSLVRGNDGLWYGMNTAGGSFGGGTIFRISEAGAFKVVKHLNAITDGSVPRGNLVVSADGSLYGITSAGGTGKAGTIFKLTAAGAFSVMKHFNLKTEGGTAFGSLIIQKTLTLIADPQWLKGTEDSSKAIVLTGKGATPLTFTIVTAPRNGTITSGLAANRIYTPRANYAGKDSFYFTANFGCISSPPAKVLIELAPVNNDAPVLDSIRSKTITAGSVLNFQARAVEYDAGQLLTYSLLQAPAGASIDPKTGLFKWTPVAAGTFRFTVKAADNGVPILFDSELLTIKVNPNTPPVLDTIGARVSKTGMPLIFTAKAKDIDAGQILTYALVGAPAGMTIDPRTGIVKWTPAIAGVFRFNVKVSDNGLPVLSDQEPAMITVSATGIKNGLSALKSSGDFNAPEAVVYPNPVHDKCIVDVNQAVTNVRVSVVNISGNLLKEVPARIIGETKIEIDLSGYPAGLYFIRINGLLEMKTVKIIKL